MHPFYALLAVSAVVLSSELIQSRQLCTGKYEVCSPAGVTNSRLPPVGSGLNDLYTDLVQAVNSESVANIQKVDRREVTKKQVSVPFCCAQTTECLILPSFSIQFCWDRFTTNFYFPDGSYGSVVAGNFTDASGTKIDLIYGSWESRDGARGNIYSDRPSMMPDTSTLPMPSQWTSKGVGSAIPASELGSTATMMSSIGLTRTTISAITLPSSTITIGTSICTRCTLTIVPGLTELPTPTTLSLTNGSTFPVTIITSNSTSAPTASISMNMSSIVIPPFTSNFDRAITVSSLLSAGVIFTIAFSAFVF